MCKRESVFSVSVRNSPLTESFKRITWRGNIGSKCSDSICTLQTLQSPIGLCLAKEATSRFHLQLEELLGIRMKTHTEGKWYGRIQTVPLWMTYAQINDNNFESVVLETKQRGSKINRRYRGNNRQVMILWVKGATPVYISVKSAVRKSNSLTSNYDLLVWLDYQKIELN